LRNIFFIFVLVLLFFSGIYMFLINFFWFNLDRIQMSGDSNLTINDVTRLSPMYLGTNIFRINTGKLENDIKKDLTLSRVRVMRKLPDKIEISLQRKKPVLLINLDQLYGLTQDKEIIPLENFNRGWDIPILSGVHLKSINFYREMDIPEIQRAIDFYQAVREVNSTFMERISELDLSNSDNLILYLLPSGLKAIMGASDYKRRIARLMAILEMEEDLKKLSCVDLRFENQGVVKTKG
jgi:cell division protein FtsQ